MVIGIKGQFLVKSVYLALKTHQVVVHYKGIWNIKIPLRIKVFLWIVFKKSLLTKDNLVRRGWSGDETCRFCSNKETMDHIFFGCAVARFVLGVEACAFHMENLPTKMGEVCSWILAVKSKKEQKLITTSFAAILWVLWRTRNGPDLRIFFLLILLA
jgi:hypothetical protein